MRRDSMTHRQCERNKMRKILSPSATFLSNIVAKALRINKFVKKSFSDLYFECVFLCLIDKVKVCVYTTCVA